MTKGTVACLLGSALLGVLASAWVSSATAKPSADIVRAAANSVVRVTAEGCPGAQGTRAGSGFIWPDAATVVTALHVIADCQSVTVDYVEAGVQRRAQASRSLRRADLALLAVENPPALPALSKTAEAGEQEELAAIGLPLNVANWQETYGSRALNVRTLNDILNDAARRQIRSLGAPAIDLEIFRLTAVVKPGSSGGPVINANGAVVGVVDGGLDGGNASLNWAVPARFLQELAASGEAGANVGLGPAAETVFAFSVPETTQAAAQVNRDMTCGGRNYFHLATRNLNEIVDSLSQPGTLDDPTGFLYVVSSLSQVVALEDLAAINFDLWVDSETGATVAVPDWLALSDYGDYCAAESDEGELGFAFVSQVYDSFSTNYQMMSEQFGNAIFQEFGFAACQLDPNYSQYVPHNRFDGLIAQRAAILCLDGSMMDSAYVFAGSLGRLNSFLGVVAYNEDYARVGFQGTAALNRDWAAVAIAVMISTYQI